MVDSLVVSRAALGRRSDDEHEARFDGLDAVGEIEIEPTIDALVVDGSSRARTRSLQ